MKCKFKNKKNFQKSVDKLWKPFYNKNQVKNPKINYSKF